MKVSIIGSGLMGKDIALVLSNSHDIESINLVSLYSQTNKKNLEINEHFEMMSQRHKKKISVENLNKVNIRFDISDVSNSDFIIETVKEEFKAKVKLIESVNEFVDKHTHLFSNTSSLSVKKLSSYYKYPMNFLGMHFFNPAFQNKLVELIYIEENQIQKLLPYKKLLENLGKKVVVSQDSPGFIVNRLLLVQINEACEISKSVKLSCEEIDLAFKTATNNLLGPFQTADLIGNDVSLQMLNNLYKSTDKEKYKPNNLLKELVDANKLGRKTGEGFYTY